MDIERSYFRVSWFFSLWVRLIEYRTRQREVSESAYLGPRRLIISPPTDAGIPILARANAHGTTELLCFSERIRRIAEDYRSRRGIDALTTAVEPFFRIPVADGSLSAVYANCLFDFCAEQDVDLVLREVWRVLSPGGVLFASYMAPSASRTGRLWEWTFKRFTFMSNGCHPVLILPNIVRHGYRILKDESAERLGFPARFSVLEKPKAD